VISHPPRLLIVDDEEPARTRLRDLLTDLASEVPVEMIIEAEDGVEALERVTAAEIDIALVDIRMPRLDGIQLAHHLARLPRPPAVVFVTAYEQYAVQAFELSAVDYLLKPVRSARLADALRKALYRPAATESLVAAAEALEPGGRRHLRCLERSKVLLVPVADVAYLKAELKYVTARTAEREYLLDESLAHLEAEFAPHFLRIHRNCIVARQAISGYEREAGPEDGETTWSLILRGIPERLTVSRRQWPQVKAALDR
jgi:two-component system response regulator AlgR